MATRVIKQIVASKISNLTWTSHLQHLIGVFNDPDNNYIYTICVDKNGTPTVRKLTISRDVNHARAQYKAAKALVGQYVKFSVRRGWSADVWFNEIASIATP